MILKRRLSLQKMCLIGLFALFCTSVFAAESNIDSPSQLIEYLAQEKANLTAINGEVRSSSFKITEQTIQSQKAELEQEQKRVAVKIEALNGFLANQEKKQQRLKSRLKVLMEASTSHVFGASRQESVTQLKALIKVNEKSLELIAQNLALATKYQKALQDKQNQLRVWEAKQVKDQFVADKKAEIRSLGAKRKVLFDKSLQLERQKKNTAKRAMHNLHGEGQLFLNNQKILLVDNQIALVQWQIELTEADFNLLADEQDIKSLESRIEVYTNAKDALTESEKTLKRMQASLETGEMVFQTESEKASKVALAEALQTFQDKLTLVLTTTSNTLKETQDILKKQRGARQRFEDYREASWQGVIQQTLKVPFQFLQYLNNLFLKMLDHYQWQHTAPKVSFWAALSLITLLFLGARILLKRVTQEKARSRFSGHLLDGVLLLVYRNLPQILLITLISYSLLLNQVPFVQIQLLFHLLLVWLTYRFLKGIAKLSLLERAEEATIRAKKLYSRFTWLFLMGAISLSLMILGQELPLTFLMQDVFNRFFMLFLLALAWVLWKSHDTFPELLYPWFRTKKKPFQHLFVSLGYLIPLVIFTTSIIGLFGFVHMAWRLARYEAYIIVALVLYVIIRELLTDLIDFASEKMVSRLHNGWLWVEAIVKPLEKLLHFLLIVLGMIMVFRGLIDDWELMVLPQVMMIGNHQIFSGPEMHVTLFSTIEAVLILLFLIWLSKWTREFCYRWMYRGIIDAAIRNSVSVFTQYTVILLGAFLFLRVLGVDLTGMGIVLGGLAVGMGFGLRDFASNIIGGLMLLIERPVREGDLITLGEYEGRVAHIGIRSMRVSSWDHMEVLIPNAETFNKPVTNWTHQDGVVRTVLPIKVSREDDPTLVQQLIVDVLDIIPEVLKEPKAQVYLKQIDEALIEFEVRYFINVQLHTRFAVRSDVLLAITAQFKAAGIKAPIPPYRVEIDHEDDDRDPSTAADE